MKRLSGKVAIVTGAASGIGYATVQALLKEGAKVTATNIKRQEIQENSCPDNSNCIYYHHDVRSDVDWAKVVNLTKSEYGKIDVLVNNAGIYIPHTLESFSIQLWQQMMDVNALGVVLGMKHTIPHLLDNGGSIINIASVDANIGTGNSFIYTASKGAVRSVTKKFAVDYAKYKIRINSIHPGLVKTPMTQEQIASEAGSYAQFNTPLPYLGEPKDIAQGILYLASDEARYITGSELFIDGGITAL